MKVSAELPTSPNTEKPAIATHFWVAVVKPEVGGNNFSRFGGMGSPLETSTGLPPPPLATADDVQKSVIILIVSSPFTLPPPRLTVLLKLTVQS